jgi:predicted membrane protein
MSDPEITKDVEIRPSSVLLWISIAAGPFAFAVDMQSRFALVQWACFNHRGWVLSVITVTAFTAAAGGAILAWLAYGRLDYPLQRARFMALVGLALSTACAVSILANGVPHLFLGLCDCFRCSSRTPVTPTCPPARSCAGGASSRWWWPDCC